MTTATPSMGGRPQTAARAERAERAEVTGWTGWIAFAGAMLVVLGSLAIMQGLVAVVNDDWVVWTNAGALLVDITVWGWVHMAIGALVILTGVGLFTGNMAARVVGVALAGLSILVNFAFLPAYPLWGIAIIALDVIVIYALVAHGEEMRDWS
jgi:hypothetical protein